MIQFCTCNVTSSKRRHKNSMKCAIAKFLNQDGRPDRYWKSKRMKENSANDPPPRPKKEEKTLTRCGRTRKKLGFVSSPQESTFSIQKCSEIQISHGEEDEENREFNRNIPEVPILINSDVISIDLQIYDDVGSARSL